MHRKELGFIVARCLILATILLLLLAMASPSAVVRSETNRTGDQKAPSGEVLIAQFVRGPNAVTTRDSYSGSVTLTVSGIGQASATSYSDAFYILTDYGGNPIPPVYPQEFILSINGRLAATLIPGNLVPSYRPDHVYTFEIVAPGGRLTFGVLDGFSQDNTGSYVISIEGATSCQVPYFSQRDPRWIEHPLRSNGACSSSCSTIGACGCTLTSSAMTLAYYGAGLTPATLSDCMGTAACPFDWGTGATCSGGNATFNGRFLFDWNRLDQEINQNERPVILGMHLGSDPSQTHWVLATSGQGTSPDNYLVHDPWPLQGADTSLAVLVRQGYVLDYMSLYDGEPVCTSAAQEEEAANLTLMPGSPSAAPNERRSDQALTYDHVDKGLLAVSGDVMIYHVELTAVIVHLSAASTAGPVTHMQVWTDSGPDTAWQPFSTLAWVPWQPGDRVYARFRDAAGNVSQDSTDSIRPVTNPPPMPTLTPTPTATSTPTATATPTVTPTATPVVRFIWLPMLHKR